MSGTTDKVKGRVKEAVGALANDKSLKREGKMDQAAGAVKDAVDGAIDTVTHAGRRTKVAGKTDTLKGRVKEAAGALVNDKSLKRKGQIDQAAGAVKDAIGGAIDSVKRAVTGHRR